MASPYRRISVEEIRPNGPYAAPRWLQQSFEEIGQLVPVIVVELPELDENGHRFALDAGNRRLAAAQALGMPHLTAIVCQDGGDTERAKRILASNLHSPNWMSDAQALEMLGGDDRALRLAGLSSSQAKNRRKLLRLTPAFRVKLQEGHLTLGAAKLLCKLEPADQEKAWALAVDAQCQSGKYGAGPVVPTVGRVKAAIRTVRGQKQEALPVPVPTAAEVVREIDPVALGAMVKELATRFAASGNISEDDVQTLIRAAVVLEREGEL